MRLFTVSHERNCQHSIKVVHVCGHAQKKGKRTWKGDPSHFICDPAKFWLLAPSAFLGNQCCPFAKKGPSASLSIHFIAALTVLPESYCPVFLVPFSL